MHGEAVKEIAALKGGQTQKHEVAGHQLLVHDGSIIWDELVKLPEPKPVIVHTLTGLRDYVVANRDNLKLEEVAVHVVSPTQVTVISRMTLDTRQRFEHLRAECYDRFAALPTFRFGSLLPVEVILIALMSLFEDRPESHRAQLIQMLSNAKQVRERTDDDDGVSQVATVRHGISMAREERFPNPVQLAPFRTFVEVPQPMSAFVFRAKPSEDVSESGGAALFEADGGAWRDAATAAVRDWLRSELPETVAILA